MSGSNTSEDLESVDPYYLGEPGNERIAEAGGSGQESKWPCGGAALDVMLTMGEES